MFPQRGDFPGPQIHHRCFVSVLCCVFALLSGCATIKPENKRKTPRVIWSVEFEGRNDRGQKIPLKMSQSRLLKAIENVPTPRLVRWTRLRLTGRFSLEKSRRIFKSDLERVKQLYRYYGYYNAKPRFVLEEDKTTLTYENAYRNYQRSKVILYVNEGKRVTVDKLEIDIQPKNHPQIKEIKAQLRKLALTKGGFFSTPDYRLSKGQIQKRLQDLSFALVKVRGQVIVDKEPSNPTAEIKLIVRPGPRCSFGGLQFIGNKRVKKELLRYLISFKKGQLYKVQALIDSQRVLSALGLFSTVDFKPQLDEVRKARSGPCYVPPDSKRYRASKGLCPIPIKLELYEDHFQSVKVGAGFVIDGQRNQIQLGINWTWLHVFQGLDTLTLDAKPGLAFLPDIFRQYDVGPDATVSLSFKRPILSINAEYGARLLYRYASQVGSADFQTLSPSTWFSLPIFKKLNLRVSWNVEVAFGVQNPLTLERENYVLDYFEQQLVLDLRDDILRTTKGIFFSLSLQEAGLFGGKFSYFKVSPEFRFFIPLPAGMVLAGRLQYGLMFSSRNLTPEEQQEVSERDALLDPEERRVLEIVRRSPLTQRFFTGGANSVRGWTARFLGPLACQIRSQQPLTQGTTSTGRVGNQTGGIVRRIGQRDSVAVAVPGAGQQYAGARCQSEAAEVARSRFGDLASRRSGLPQGAYPGSLGIPSDAVLQVIPMGGEHLMLGSLELRIPLSFILSSFGAVLFVDAGLVQLVPRIFNDAGELAEDLRPSVSVGGGIRYHLSFGAIRVDLAWKLFPDSLRYPLQQGFEIHLSFGESF